MKKLLTEIVAKNIQELLEARGENSVTAGKRSGIDQKTVWNYTQAETCNPTLKKVDLLAKALDIHPSLLMIESAFANGVPDHKTAELIYRILQLSPTARRQVSEFIEMWERPKSEQ
jgi:transcriptional regulator with XRE-family HTH domain